jgi:hypothetical protein
VIGGFLHAVSVLVARGQAIDTEHPGSASSTERLVGMIYIGALAALVLALGLSAARRVWPLAAVGVVFLLLSLDWPEGFGFLNLWDAVREWPILRSQRAPSRWLGLALVAFVLCAGVGLQRLWVSAALARHRRLAMAAAIALLAVVGLDLHLEPALAADRPGRRAARASTGRPATRRRRAAPGGLVEFAPNRLVYRETPHPGWFRSPSSGSSATSGGSRDSSPASTGTAWPSWYRRADTRSRCASDPACSARESR